ncbi:MAG: hypothetical protein ACFFFG_03560 [Candidatus Thorarchaeota archaeon]
MVRLNAFYLITDEGFTLYNQSFGATEQDQDMVGSLIMALTTFGKEVMSESSLKGIEFGEKDAEGAEMVLEEGVRIKAIAIVVFDKDNKERDELKIRYDLRTFVREIEEIYAEELGDPIFRKGAFSGIGALISAWFFRDKMSLILHDQFDPLNVYLKYPTTLLFEITPFAGKLYSFYRDFPPFQERLSDITPEEFDDLIEAMSDKNSMISFKDCLERFGEDRGGQILTVFRYLTQKGMFDAYNFERITI